MSRLVVEVEHLVIYGEASEPRDLETRISEQLARLLFAQGPVPASRDALAEAIAFELWQALREAPAFIRILNGEQA